MTTDSPERATIYSLHQWQVSLSDEVREHLTAPLQTLYDSNKENADAHLQRILQAMKRPPLQSVCRVNRIQSSREHVMQGLQQGLAEWIVTRGGDLEHVQIMIQPHALLDDTILVNVIPKDTTTTLEHAVRPPNNHHHTSDVFSQWPLRESMGWPTSHRAILCDRFCAEAVLRGSDIFVRGILLADAGILAGDVLAVYAHLGNGRKVTRGRTMEKYQGECLFLGLGTAACHRADLFRLHSGLGVTMSPFPWERAGPSMPPLSGILPHAMMPQNLPSILVVHALQPERHDTILDMCAAPGGKTLHLASWTRNEATIVACDRSRRKMLAAGEAFQKAGATCITPLALDTTSCVLQDDDDGERRSVPSVSIGIYLCMKFQLDRFTIQLIDFFCSTSFSDHCRGQDVNKGFSFGCQRILSRIL